MMTDDKIHLQRNNSVCPSPDKQLLDAVKSNDLTTIQTIINTYPYLKNYIYPEIKRTILQIALNQTSIETETIKLLINLNVNLDNCLHLICQYPDVEILEIYLKLLKPGDINQKNQLNNNCLHELLKSERLQQNPDRYLDHIRLLLHNGIDINCGDNKNCTPILLAAKNQLKSIIKLLIDSSIEHIDLDKEHKLLQPNVRGKTARQLIEAYQLYPGRLPEKSRIEIDPKLKLFDSIKLSKEDEFIEYYQRINYDNINDDNGNYTLLQLSCERHLYKIVKFLIDNGVDVNLTIRNNQKTPLEYCAENGDFPIFKLLIDQIGVVISPEILCILLKNYDNYLKNDQINHENCCKYLLDKSDCLHRIDLNYRDLNGNTALHYALRYTNPEMVRRLLKAGASLGVKNNFKLMPIHDIDPELLQQHLDDCIRFDERYCDKQDFEIVFDYRNLIDDNRKQPETEVIEYMSRTQEFKYLLNHPLIVSFLLMKWHKIRCIFYTNFLFYLIFIVSLFGYIFTYYADLYDDSLEIESKFCLFLLYFTYILLMIRELFQITVSPSNYYKNFENYIEILLIIVTGMILTIDTPTIHTRKQLSSIALLLGAFELVLMLGQHPKFTTNVVMFKTVAANFAKLFFWYSSLIIAFAFSFYILFAKTDNININNSTSTTNDDNNGEDDEIFTDPGKSLFKTIIMLTGEFDAGSINFQLYPKTSKIIFGLFVFMITIILFNLLNGLAVSDTQTIKNDAELVGNVARAQHVYYVETMLFGNLLPMKLLKFLQKYCCCLPFLKDNFLVLKPLIRKISLFSYTKQPELFVLPNNYGRIYYQNLPKKSYNDNCQNDVDDKLIKTTKFCYSHCTNIYLDKETIRRTNLIIKKRREQIENEKLINIEHLYNEQIKIKEKLEQILKMLEEQKQ